VSKQILLRIVLKKKIPFLKSRRFVCHHSQSRCLKHARGGSKTCGYNIKTLTHTYIQTCSYAHIHTCIHVCIHVNIHIHKHMYIYTYTHTCTHTYLCTHICTYIHISINTYIHTCMHLYIHAYIYILININTYMYT
jgi:hypothetical protein